MAEELVVACDPQIEVCEDASPFQNTIELDYAGPNMRIGVLTIVNALIPQLLYSLWIARNVSAEE